MSKKHKHHVMQTTTLGVKHVPNDKWFQFVIVGLVAFFIIGTILYIIK